MRTRELAREKFKPVCEDLPNLAILTKSAIPGEFQLKFAYASIVNKPPGESVTALSLVGSLEAPEVVSINYNIAFANAGDKIKIPVTKVLL